MADSSQADPSVPGQSKGTPINPSETKGLARLPNEVKSTASNVDELLVRLSKLIKTTAGLGAGLSTLNYGLYLLAYLHSISPSRLDVIAYISRLVGRSPLATIQKLPPSATTPPVVSPFMTTGAMIGDLRTTLRLTGLIPLYVLLKSVLAKRNDSSVDSILYRVSVVQCLGYIFFQSIENTYHLVNKGVLPATVTAQRGGTPKWLMWSCRCWLVAVASDFFRLARESQLEQQKRDRGEKVSAEEQKEIDKKWWASLQTALSWMPVAIHYSSPNGLKGMNLGLVGLCGVSANINNLRNAWAATKE